jgi:hypothetical protein
MYDQANHRHYEQQVNHPTRHVEGSPGNQPHHQQNKEKDQKKESHQSTPGGLTSISMTNARNRPFP